MDWYLIVKTIHIISATLLFGTGLGIAFFFLQAHRHSDLSGGLTARYFAARTTVLADSFFTLPAVLVQPITGVWLVQHSGYDWQDNWLFITLLLYLLAGACWLPVVWIQIKLKALLGTALQDNLPLPPIYHRLFKIWFALGWPAFLSLVIIFYLMVAKPT